MKALRYLLIVMGLMSVLSISAQALAQQPEARMQSTSIMAPCGSALPQAAVTGAVTTNEGQPKANISQPRRVRPGDNEDPYKDPIGDAMWPLALLACVYVLFRVRMRKRA